VNDQLVDVNGTSLLGVDNARAIQVLREAMMKDGRIHGFIGITVLRPRSNAAKIVSPCRELRVSQADHDDSVAGGNVPVLPRPDPVARLTDKDSASVTVTLPTDISQVLNMCT